MKKLIVLLSVLIPLLMMGCAGMEINWNVDKDVLALGAACEVGYQLAKQYPEIANIAYKYAQDAIAATEPGAFQEQLDKWKDYILERIGADPHYKRQLSRFMPNIALPEGDMPDMAWVDKAKPYIQEFIYGIEDAWHSSIVAALERYRAKLTARVQVVRARLDG